MKRIFYIFCCLTAVGLTVYLAYSTWKGFAERDWYENLIYLIAIIGWCIISEKMINKKYKWIQKFFK